MNAEDALKSMPAQIRRTENEVFQRKQGLDGLRLRLKLREADLTTDIAAALEREGKKSNADTREALLRASMQADPEASAARRALIDEEALISRMQSTLEFYQSVQRNARVLVLARSPSTLVFDDPELAQ